MKFLGRTLRKRNKFFILVIFGAIVILFGKFHFYSNLKVRNAPLESIKRFVSLSGLAHLSESSNRSLQEENLLVEPTNRFVDVSRLPVSSNQNTVISIYLEMFKELVEYYEETFIKIEKTSQTECPLPDNAVCIYQHTDKMADVVFRFVSFYIPNQDKIPYRYCDGQLVAVLNSEAETPEMMEPLRKADIRLDHHLASEITIAEACSIPWEEGIYKTPDPSKRKGVALFMSNCNVKWRNDYILELARHIHIHSYGACWHNVSDPDDRKNWTVTRYSLAKKHRMVVTFENKINHMITSVRKWHGATKQELYLCIGDHQKSTYGLLVTTPSLTLRGLKDLKTWQNISGVLMRMTISSDITLQILITL